MALWYQCDVSTWWYWSYVADLGPYDGTVPLPRPLWLPNEAAEIDYVVGIPHPSGDPRRFRDGTYDVHVLEGDFSGSYSYSNTPGGPLFGSTYGSPTGPAPGAHLFIQFYRTGYPSGPTLPPPRPALAYVPSTLIAGGYGPTISEGHWSPWQPRFDVELSAPVDVWPVYGRGTSQSYLSTTDGGTEFDDAQTIFNDWRDALNAADGSGSGVENGRSLTLPNPPFSEGPRDADLFAALNYVAPDLPDFSGSVGFGVGGNRASWIFAEAGAFAFGGGHTYGYGFSLGWGYIGQNVNGSVNDTSLQTPPALSDLTFGVDFTTVPGDQIGPHTQGYVDFESGTATFQGWINEIYGADVEMHCDIIDGGDVPDTIPLTIWWKSTDTSQLDLSTAGSAFNRPWLDYEDGTVLEHVELPATPGTTFDHYYNETTTDLTIDLSSVSAKDFSLVIQPRWADPAVDVPGPFAPGGATYWSTQHIDGTDLCSANYLDVRALRPLGGNPYGTWRQPRWRYWVPGGLEFHCPGGARPRITVTEGHWSAWQPPQLVGHWVGGSGRYFNAYRSTQEGAVGDSIIDLATAARAAIASGGGDPTSSGSSEELFGLNARRDESGTHVVLDLGYSAQRIESQSTVFLSDGTLDGDPYYVNYFTYGSDWASAPVDQRTSLTSADGYLDFQSAEFAYQGWQQFTLSTLLHTATSADADVFPDQLDIPLTLSATDAEAAHSGDAILGPDYDFDAGIHIVDYVATIYGPSYSIDWHYSINAVDISTLGLPQSFNLVLQCGWQDLSRPVMDLAMFPGVEFPYPSGGETFDVFTRGLSSPGDLQVTALYRTPPWRYWIPTDTKVQCTTPILRLNQRNDGRGSSRHPRLLSSTSAPSSRQRSAAPRLGPNGHYL